MDSSSFLSSTPMKRSTRQRSANIYDFSEMMGSPERGFTPIPRAFGKGKGKGKRTREEDDDDDDDNDEDYEDIGSNNGNYSDELDDNESTSRDQLAYSFRVDSPDLTLAKPNLFGRNPDNSDLDDNLLSSPDASPWNSDEDDNGGLVNPTWFTSGKWITTMKNRGIVTKDTDLESPLCFPYKPTRDEIYARLWKARRDAMPVIKPRVKQPPMAFKYEPEVFPDPNRPVKPEKSDSEKAALRKLKSCALPLKKRRKYEWKDMSRKNKTWLEKEMARREKLQEERRKADEEADRFI